MKLKIKTIITIAILACIVTGSSIGFYLYNKGPVDIRHARAIPVKSVDLYTLYSKDTLAAKKKFTDKVLAVSGEVVKVSQNEQQQKIILLKSGNSLAAVNCTLEGVAENIKPSDKITIKGICSGIGESDPDMGIMGDVYLTRCFVSK